MAFKPWEALSPAYRARLERKGITQQTHTALKAGKKVAGTPNLTAARGKAISLPHMKPVRVAREKRDRERKYDALANIRGRERKLGYLSDNDLLLAVRDIGIDGARILVEWQEYKLANSVKGKNGQDKEGRPLLTFEQYVGEHYGPDLWDSVYEDYWSEAQEIEGMGFYN